MPEKAEAKANEQINSTLGVKCKSNIKAGNVLNDIKSRVNTQSLTTTLQDYAMFPFSLVKECECSKS